MRITFLREGQRRNVNAQVLSFTPRVEQEVFDDRVHGSIGFSQEFVAGRRRFEADLAVRFSAEDYAEFIGAQTHHERFPAIIVTTERGPNYRFVGAHLTQVAVRNELSSDFTYCVEMELRSEALEMSNRGSERESPTERSIIRVVILNIGTFGDLQITQEDLIEIAGRTPAIPIIIDGQPSPVGSASKYLVAGGALSAEIQLTQEFLREALRARSASLSAQLLIDEEDEECAATLLSVHIVAGPVQVVLPPQIIRKPKLCPDCKQRLQKIPAYHNLFACKDCKKMYDAKDLNKQDPPESQGRKVRI